MGYIYPSKYKCDSSYLLNNRNVDGGDINNDALATNNFGLLAVEATDIRLVLF